MYKVKNNLLPHIFISNFIINNNISERNTRQNDLYFIPKFRTHYLESTVLIQGPRIANEYKALFETHSSIGTFKKILKEVLFSTMV